MPRLNLETGLKECSKCHEELTPDNFRKDSRAYDKLMVRCKKCMLNMEHNKSPEKLKRIKEYQKSYGADNREHLTKYHKKYRKENKDDLKIKRDQRYKDNRDKYLEMCRIYRTNNKEACQETIRKWGKTQHGVIKTLYLTQLRSSKDRYHPAPTYNEEELGEWMYANGYENLWDIWTASHHLKDKKPSCDRLDSLLPYSLDNLQLVTWETNNRRGVDEKSIPVESYDPATGETVKGYISQTECGDEYGVHASVVRGWIERGVLKKGRKFRRVLVNLTDSRLKWKDLMSYLQTTHMPDCTLDTFKKYIHQQGFEEMYRAWAISGYTDSLRPTMVLKDGKWILTVRG